MSQVEDRLREDLLRATDFAVDVDAEAVLAAGRKDRSRRLVRTAGIGLAATVAAGAVALAGLGGRLDNGLPQVGMTVAASPSPAPKAAAGTASFDALEHYLTKSVTYTDGGEVTATPQVTPETPMRVDVSPQGLGRYELVVTTVSGERTAKTVEVEPGRSSMAVLLPRVLVGVIGGEANWVDARPVDAGTAGGWVDTEPVGEAWDATAFVMVLPEDAGAAEVSAVVWADVDGHLHDSAGVSLVTAKVTLGESKGVVYLDPEGAWMGYHDDAARDLRVKLQDDWQVSFAGMASWSESQADAEEFGVGVLPKGAADAEFKWHDDVTQKSASTLQLGDREVFVVSARLARSAEPVRMDGGLKAVTFTAADGTTGTHLVGE